MILADAINRQRTQCRLASGSERMQDSMLNPPERSYFIVDRGIRSLALAVLHQLRFKLDSTVSNVEGLNYS
jgi:hypothetical protein